MKIWKEFGSSHSANITIISKFKTFQEANSAKSLIEDFILAVWEERYTSLSEFVTHWNEEGDRNIPYIGISESDFNLGIDDNPDIIVTNNELIINGLRTENLGGIIKLLFHRMVDRIEITGTGL